MSGAICSSILPLALVDEPVIPDQIARAVVSPVPHFSSKDVDYPSWVPCRAVVPSPNHATNAGYPARPVRALVLRIPNNVQVARRRWIKIFVFATLDPLRFGIEHLLDFGPPLTGFVRQAIRQNGIVHLAFGNEI